MVGEAAKNSIEIMAYLAPAGADLGLRLRLTNKKYATVNLFWDTLN